LWFEEEDEVVINKARLSTVVNKQAYKTRNASGDEIAKRDFWWVS